MKWPRTSRCGAMTSRMESGAGSKSTVQASSLAATLVDAGGRCFLEADDAAGNVPAGAVELVGAPGEQGAALPVADQQVDVDERGQLADQAENRGRQAPARGLDAGE